MNIKNCYKAILEDFSKDDLAKLHKSITGKPLNGFQEGNESRPVLEMKIMSFFNNEEKAAKIINTWLIRNKFPITFNESISDYNFEELCKKIPSIKTKQFKILRDLLTASAIDEQLDIFKTKYDEMRYDAYETQDGYIATIKCDWEKCKTENRKLEKVKDELANKNSEFENSTNGLNEKIKDLERENNKILNQDEQVGVLYRNLQEELKIGKAQAFKNYLDEEKKKHDQDLQNIKKEFIEKRLKIEADEESQHKNFINNQNLEKEELSKEIAGLSGSLSVLQTTKAELQNELKSLDSLKKTAIKEYSEYVENGQKWYNLINGSKPNEVIESPQVAEITNADITAIEKYKSYFKNIKMDSDIDDVQDQISSFENDRLKKVKKLFLPDTNFILCADSSWLSFDLFMQNSYGCLETSEFLETISLKEFLEIAGANQDLSFKVIILSANRAPVECYFNPIIKAIKNKISIVYNKELLKIPKNVYWFLQFDNDNYCAKTDKLDIGEF